VWDSSVTLLLQNDINGGLRFFDRLRMSGVRFFSHLLLQNDINEGLRFFDGLRMSGVRFFSHFAPSE